MQNLPASLTPATSVSILPDAAQAAAHHDPIQHIKVDALLQWNLWPLARTGASDTCVVRGSGGGEKLDLILSLPKKHPVAAEVKGLTFGPGGLLQAADPSNRPLDLAYPWATGAFIGPGPHGCGPKKESVRAEPTRSGLWSWEIYGLLKQLQWPSGSKNIHFVSWWWMIELFSDFMLFLHFDTVSTKR